MKWKAVLASGKIMSALNEYLGQLDFNYFFNNFFYVFARENEVNTVYEKLGEVYIERCWKICGKFLTRTFKKEEKKIKRIITD